MISELSNGSLWVNGALSDSSTPAVEWIVQKFGGTSIGKFAETIVQDVVGYLVPSS